MSLNGNAEKNQALDNLKGKISSIPPIDETLTQKGSSADAKATGDALSKKVNITDIVDNLITDNAKKPLSAKQGVEIKRRIDDIDPHFADNVIYNNKKSGLSALEMQSAIDELSQDNKEIKNDYVSKANKPTGSYKGNGSATTRTIQINGIGGCLAVFSGSYMIGFITQNGAVFFSTQDSTVHCFPVSTAKYMSGVLTLNSDDTYLNGNGNIYYYQVL